MIIFGHDFNIINLILILLLVIIFIYIGARIVFTAIFISWWNVKDLRFKKLLRRKLKRRKEEDENGSSK